MTEAGDTSRDLTNSVSTNLANLRVSVPEVMKDFSELGRAALMWP